MELGLLQREVGRNSRAVSAALEVFCSGRPTIPISFEDIAAIVARSPDGRYLVAGFTTSGEQSDKSIAALLGINQKVREIYGSKFVDILPDLLAASDGSPGDEDDVARGIVPRSLRVDDVHLTDKGYGIAAAFARAHIANGF
jgi:hypothetical protein